VLPEVVETECAIDFVVAVLAGIIGATFEKP